MRNLGDGPVYILKDQSVTMQEVARTPDQISLEVLAIVPAITDNGVASMAEVNPNLMFSSSHYAHPEQREDLWSTLPCRDSLKLCPHLYSAERRPSKTSGCTSSAVLSNFCSKTTSSTHLAKRTSDQHDVLSGQAEGVLLPS